MLRPNPYACACAASLGLLAAGEASAQTSTAPEAAAIILDSRLRYESVDQDGLDRADALTLRTRFGVRSARLSGWQVLAEGEAVGSLVEDYNDTINGKTGFPVVPDPETLELNRLQASFNGLPGTEIIIGRQRLVLDNARFVGNVGFRQNEQTFDAVVVRTDALGPFRTTYGYIDRVQRIFGDDSPAGVWRSDSHLLNVSGDSRFGKLTGYGYWLDFENAPAQSSATVGVRLEGRRAATEGLALNWALELARQSEHGDNPNRFDVGYGLVSGGVSQGPLAVNLAFERLGADSGQAFQTPLATLHAFQGWADVFLTTPTDGLTDLSATTSWTVRQPPVGRSAVLTAAWREYRDGDRDLRFGRELNVSARLMLDAHWSMEAKLARFDGARPAFPDRTKVWFALEHSF